MPTINDIAKKAGVSLGTVSNVLNNPEKVKKETLNKVLKVIELTGFVPNINARNLSRSKTDTITLIYPYSNRPRKENYYSSFLAGVIEVCFKENFKLVLSSHPHTFTTTQNLKLYEQLIDSGGTDGVIITRPELDDPVINFLCMREQNFVVFGRSNVMHDFSWVDIDGKSGIEQSVRYLSKLKHRRIAYINTPGNYAFSHHRLEGYKQGLKNEGIIFDADLLIHSSPDDDEIEFGKKRVLELLQIQDPPSAVIVAGSQLAIGVVKGIEKFGYTIGKDISVICFDDTDWSKHYTPPITTLRQPLYKAGGMVASMLINHIHDGSFEVSHELLKPELVIRESCCRI